MLVTGKSKMYYIQIQVGFIVNGCEQWFFSLFTGGEMAIIMVFYIAVSAMWTCKEIVKHCNEMCGRMKLPLSKMDSREMQMWYLLWCLLEV